MNSVLVCGAGGFIGHHLVKSLKNLGYKVVGVDLKYPLYEQSPADHFYIMDLRSQCDVANLFTKHKFLQIYQLAADMGGAGYVFTGKNDANIMSNSVTINLNILHNMVKHNISKVFYSSSACVYPEHLQTNAVSLTEEMAYPACPDSEYGWEKLFSERLYLNYRKNYNIDAKIARFHNVFGPLGSWNNGKEKSPAAICRKIARAKDNDSIEIWGDGFQTRSFLYISECIKGIHSIMNSNITVPVNLGSENSISINELVDIVAKIAGKNISKYYVSGPTGVNNRSSNNDFIFNNLQWKPTENLEHGLKVTYEWISNQIADNLSDK